MYRPIPYTIGLPASVTTKAVLVYFILLGGVSLIFTNYVLSWYWWAFGIVGVVAFFYLGKDASRKWSNCSTKKFEQRVFITTWLIRSIYVIVAYLFFMNMTGIPHEINAGDAKFYSDAGIYGAHLLREGNFFHLYPMLNDWCNGHLMFSDCGAPIFWSIMYLITNDNILLARILQCFLSAGMCIFMYRLATRNFGEETGRLTAVMCMLMPNFFFYCATSLKETCMLFLIALFVERADLVLRDRHATVLTTVLMLSSALILFAFRTALGGVLLVSLFVALILSSTKVVGWGKRILISLCAIAFLAITFNNEIEQELQSLTNRDLLSNQQSANEDRSKRTDGKGNSFAVYATATVMAPLIFTVPFPTFVEVPYAETQIMNNAGNYVKNVTSFFTILAMFVLLLSGDWRKHVLPICVVVGYLFVLVMSSFAHSERFHIPSLPFELMFAAYMMTKFREKKKYERWFLYWMVLVLVAGFGWNWIKLSGRGYL